MEFRAGDRRVRVDAGHFVFVLAIAAYCVWFLFDARASSSNLQNMILIEPAVLVAVVLCGFVLRETISVERHEGARTEEDREPALAPRSYKARIEDAARSGALQLPLFVVLLVLYVFSIDLVGFDVASFLFIALSLLLQGVRHIGLVLVLPLAFTALMVWAFKTVLMVPVNTLFG